MGLVLHFQFSPSRIDAERTVVDENMSAPPAPGNLPQSGAGGLVSWRELEKTSDLRSLTQSYITHSASSPAICSPPAILRFCITYHTLGAGFVSAVGLLSGSECKMFNSQPPVQSFGLEYRQVGLNPGPGTSQAAASAGSPTVAEADAPGRSPYNRSSRQSWQIIWLPRSELVSV